MNKRRIKPAKLEHRGNIPRPPRPPEPEQIRFSFKYIDLHGSPKFSVSVCGNGYVLKFLERLRAIEGMGFLEFMQSRSPALRCHPIRFEDTTEHDGFICLNGQLRDLPPYQFSISGNEHGRVHGFVLESTFYVVWLDPNHRLYA